MDIDARPAVSPPGSSRKPGDASSNVMRMAAIRACGALSTAVLGLTLALVACADKPMPTGARASKDRDAKRVSELDAQYQGAVQRNDAATMDRLLSDDFILVTGSGKTLSKADLLEETHSGQVSYERQEDSDQVVRVWGDTAVLTAKLWAKGTEKGHPFEYRLWFSDTYVRTPQGWKYVFGQAAGPSPTQQNGGKGQ